MTNFVTRDVMRARDAAAHLVTTNVDYNAVRSVEPGVRFLLRRMHLMDSIDDAVRSAKIPLRRELEQ